MSCLVQQAHVGWWHSDYQFLIDSPEHNIHGILTSRVFHGPLPWTRLQRGQWIPRLAEAISTLDFSASHISLPSLNISQRFDLFGNIETRWQSLAYLKKHPQDTLEIAISDGSFRHNRAESHVQGELKIPDLRWQRPSARFQLRGVKLAFAIAGSHAQVPVGEMTVQLQSLDILSDQQQYTFENLQFKVLLSEFADSGHLQWIGSSQRIDTPYFEFTDNHWEFMIRGIDNFRWLTSAAQISGDYQAIPFQQRLVQFLSGTELEVVHLESKLASSSVQGFLRIQMPVLLSDLPVDPSVDGPSLFPQIVAHAELALPKEALRKLLSLARYQNILSALPEGDKQPVLPADIIDQKLNIIVAQGLVTESAGQYLFNIELHRGELFFNGYKVHHF